MNWQELHTDVSQAGARLVAVSKRQPLERVQAVWDQGCRILGENYLEGLEERAQQFPEAQLHYIGRIQRRKLRKIIELSEWIHGLCRTQEAATAARIEKETGFRRNYMMQIHIGGESSKGGVEPEQATTLWMSWKNEYPDLYLRGLMMIGPARETEDQLRTDFAQLRSLRDQIAVEDPACRELSMGMSHDWQIALDEGATMVRVGSALFGDRP